MSQRLSSAVRQSAQRLSSLRSNKEKDEIRQRPALLEHGILLDEKIGVGGQGEVFKGHFQKDEKYVAIKIITKASCKDKASIEAVKLEISLLKDLDHPNIVQFFLLAQDEYNWYVVTELLNGGDLYDRIQKGAFSDMQLIKFAEYTFSILKYLHANGIAHRDLKLENFMLHKDPTTGLETIKLIDFGLAYRKKEGKKYVHDDHPGTLSYQSPEIVKQQAYMPEKVDVWCAGVMLYSAIEKAFPFYGGTEKEIEHSICTAKPQFICSGWKSVGQEFEDIIKACLDKDQKKRPTAAQALKKVVAISERKVILSPRHNPRNVNLTEKDTKIHRIGRSISSKIIPKNAIKSIGSKKNLSHASDAAAPASSSTATADGA